MIPVSGPLLLSRTSGSCEATYFDGPNINKCADVDDGYAGEYCLDNFKIPDDHLEGLWEWNDSDPEPTTEYFPNGAGLVDTDFILYVRAKHTSTCNSGDIIAYAAYCNLDQNDRPIAGYSNFCPSHLSEDNYDESTFILTAAHEIFHALGFSNSLFEKFKECTYNDTSGLQCEDRSNVLTTDSQGQVRLTTPSVINKTQDHFGCTAYDFGGPLENKGSSGASSHWEARLMLGSLMTSTIGLPYLTLIDPITLAVFEDTGWYKVDYSNAQDLLWGNDQGCNFGLVTTCDSDNSFFCSGSDFGCHHLHMHKGNCTTNDYLEDCRIYKADEKYSCLDAANGDSEDLTTTGESYASDSRCFLATISTINKNLAATGRCYKTRCNDTYTLEVQVGDTPWQLCPSNTTITIPGYNGVVTCPPINRICNPGVDLLSFPTTTLLPEVTTVTDSTVTIEFVIDMDYELVSEESQQENFREAVIIAISRYCQISRERIEILQVIEGSVIVTLQIKPAGDSHGTPTSQVYSDLEYGVSEELVYVLFNGVNYTTIEIRLLEEGPTTTTKEPSGISDQMIGIVLGVVCVCGVMLIILIVALCKTKKQRRVVAPMYMENGKEVAPTVRMETYRNE
ncbi:ciliated left-right organizer metallopeptidase-like isoform X2 [Ptychodera flava]|uniref:ciliated left-right organizer metallopeptidase-like isoform X2 n=1 Tax=Ptychodera flava TaxID=63121 RepID=UPI003969CC22